MSGEHSGRFEPSSFKWEDGISATPAQIARLQLGLPDNMKGAVVIDLCSGACPLVDELNKEGAVAYGVDMCYELDEERLFGAIFNSRDILMGYVPAELQDVMWNSTQETIEAFATSYTAQRLRPEVERQYIGADVAQLDKVFPEGLADYAVSLNGLLLLGDDPELFLTTIAQTARITKPGGTIILATTEMGKDELGDILSLLSDRRLMGLVQDVQVVTTGVSERPELGNMTRITLSRSGSMSKD